MLDHSDLYTTSVVRRVIDSLDLGSFVRDQDMAQYLWVGDLDAFVSHDELNAKNYVDRTFANNSMSTPTLLPLNLSDGLLALEKDVKDPGGAIDRLIITLQDLKNRKAGKVVNVGPYTFNNQSETDLWMNTLDVSHTIGFAV